MIENLVIGSYLCSYLDGLVNDKQNRNCLFEQVEMDRLGIGFNGKQYLQIICRFIKKALKKQVAQ